MANVAAGSDAPQVERAYRSIKAAIVEGRYRPGAPLSEVMLAREHGMSRTPVREGLARLWQERYLDRVVGHGYFVARVTVQSIHDTFDVRRLLEGAAAAKAAGATVIMSNHSEFDNAITKNKMLAGRGKDAHPYEVGAEAVQRYFTVMQSCARAAQIRLEERAARGT